MKRIERFLKAGVVLCGLLGLVSSAYAFSATAGDLQGVVYADSLGGIDGAQVKVYTGPNETGTLKGTTTTATFSGIKGYYCFNNLSASASGTTYYLSARDTQASKRFADKIGEPAAVFANQIVGHDIKVSTSGKIEGVVSNLTKNYLPTNGVYVKVNASYALTKNQAPVGDGYYSFSEVVPNDYTLIFAKAGFISDSKAVTVIVGGVANGDKALAEVAPITWSSQDGGTLRYDPFVGGIYRDYYYDYGPAIITNSDSSYKQVWWCGSFEGTSGDRILYTDDSGSGWNTASIVLSPANTWAGSDGLIADPTVIKGNFTYNANNYTYAMYFTGTTYGLPSDPDNGQYNRIGVAFSNNGVSWVVYPNYIIAPEGSEVIQKWGTGMPSAYRDSTIGTIWLVYLDSTADTGNKIRLRKSNDGINFSAPQATFLDNPDGGHPAQQGPDIAYEPAINKWNAVTKDGIDTVISIWRSKNTGLEAVATDWELIGQIDLSRTQQVKNHNPGIFHLDNGNIYAESSSGKHYIAFGCGYGETAANNLGNESWDIHLVAYTPVKQETPNQPPVLNAIGDKTVNEGELLQFTISATDPDGDTLTYSANNLPSGATFNASTRTFSWTPTSSQAGTYVGTTFIVSDGKLTDSESITITVNDVSSGDLQGVVYADGVGGINGAKVSIYTGPNETGTLIGWTTTANAGNIVGYYCFNGLKVIGSSSTYYLSARDNQISKRFFDKIGDAAIVLPNKLNAYDIKVTYDKTAPSITSISDSPDPFYIRKGQVSTIKYTLGDNLSTKLTVYAYIYTSGGTLVRTLGPYTQSLGVNSVTWNGKNSSGAYVANATYKYRIKATDSAGNYIYSGYYYVTKK